MSYETGDILGIGIKILEIRKALGLTQEEFSKRLRVNKGTISNLEKDRQNPSEQLIRLICLEFVVSENWLKTGEGEMFLSPNAALKTIMSRYNEQDIIESFSVLMKERGLAMAIGRHGHRADSGDPELDQILNVLYALWETGDEKLKTWAAVQFDFAITKHVDEEILKKQKEPHEHTFVG